MKIRVELKNHGFVNGVMHDGGDIVEIDDKQFTETWMRKIVLSKEIPKKRSLLQRIFKH